MSTLTFDDLLGRTFLLPPHLNGERLQAKVIDQVIEFENDHQDQEEQLRVKIKVLGQDHFEEFICYNQLTEYLEENQDFTGNQDDLFKFRCIMAHQGPLDPSPKDYNCSCHNLLVEWETVETTYEPLSLPAGDDLVTCAEYGERH